MGETEDSFIFLHLFCAASSYASISDSPCRRHQAVCAAGCFSSKSLPLGAQSCITGQGEGGGAYGIQVTHIGCAEFPRGPSTNVTGAQLQENTSHIVAHPFRPVRLTHLPVEQGWKGPWKTRSPVLCLAVGIDFRNKEVCELRMPSSLRPPSWGASQIQCPQV